MGDFGIEKQQILGDANKVQLDNDLVSKTIDLNLIQGIQQGLD
jgi:hypothetical protein